MDVSTTVYFTMLNNFDEMSLMVIQLKYNVYALSRPSSVDSKKNFLIYKHFRPLYIMQSVSLHTCLSLTWPNGATQTPYMEGNFSLAVAALLHGQV